MSEDKLKTDCPRCGQPTEAGFCLRNAGLSFVSVEKIEKAVSSSEDLAEPGIKKFLPAKAEYYRSYLCRDCEIYVIDYSHPFPHDEARTLANSTP